MNRPGTRAVLAFASIVALSGGLALWQVRYHERMVTLPGDEEIPMASTWTDASGVTHTVTTTQKDDETIADWVTRHTNAVAALQAIYPPA